MFNVTVPVHLKRCEYIYPWIHVLLCLSISTFCGNLGCRGPHCLLPMSTTGTFKVHVSKMLCHVAFTESKSLTHSQLCSNTVSLSPRPFRGPVYLECPTNRRTSFSSTQSHPCSGSIVSFSPRPFRCPVYLCVAPVSFECWSQNHTDQYCSTSRRKPPALCRLENSKHPATRAGFFFLAVSTRVGRTQWPLPTLCETCPNIFAVG